MTLKEALWREVKYGMCGSDGPWHNVVDPEHVCVDARDDIDAENDPDDYPWIVIGRVVKTEQNTVQRARERMMFAGIGLLRNVAKGDDLIEQLMTDLQNWFQGTHKTIGKYTSTGGADPTGGLRVACEYINTTDGFSDSEEEKVQLAEFAFAYNRA